MLVCLVDCLNRVDEILILPLPSSTGNRFSCTRIWEAVMVVDL